MAHAEGPFTCFDLQSSKLCNKDPVNKKAVSTKRRRLYPRIHLPVRIVLATSASTQHFSTRSVRDTPAGPFANCNRSNINRKLQSKRVHDLNVLPL